MHMSQPRTETNKKRKFEDFGPSRDKGTYNSFIEVYLVSSVEFIDTRARFEAEGFLKDEFLAKGSQLLHLWSFSEWVSDLEKIYKDELLTEPAKGFILFSRPMVFSTLKISFYETNFSLISNHLLKRESFSPLKSLINLTPISKTIDTALRVLKQRQKDEKEGIVNSDSSLDLQSLIQTIEKSSTKPRCDEGTFCHLFDDIAHTKSFIHPWSPKEVCSKLDCNNSECERAHICRSGGRCLLSDEYFHRQKWIHPKKTDCNEGTSCSLLNDEDHLNLYSHPGIQDFRPACQKTAAELKEYYPPETRKALFLLQCIHSRAKKSNSDHR